MNEYHIKISNGIIYGYQFNIKRELTAHTKLDNLRQLALWIEEMENYDKQDIHNDKNSKLTVYCFSTEE